MLRSNLFREISTSLIILMFSYAAFSKLFMLESTRFEWLGHNLIKDYAGILAWLVPAIELFIVSLLLFPATRKAGLFSSIGLLIIFTGYIIYMFNFYPDTPCSCGGILRQLGWKQHILFNLFFIALAAGLLPRKRTHDHEQSGRMANAHRQGSRKPVIE